MSSPSKSGAFAARSKERACVCDTSSATSAYPVQCLLNFLNSSDHEREAPLGALAGEEDEVPGGGGVSGGGGGEVKAAGGNT